ncbi:MAG TPA: carbamoyltransferase C-terminal domain-containing protein [Oligoflexia bacterium]|nr:carbamoyltransferase C-terminal domain-containing protein [Oligoflexia bacterium]
MIILGLATMTESSAALLIDGKCAACVEEERFTRIKHSGGFPFRSIAAVLAQSSLSLADVDAVAVYWDPYRLAFRARYLIETFFYNPKLFCEKIQRAFCVWHGAAGTDSGWADMFKTAKYLQRSGACAAPIRFLDHHECHIAGSFFISPFERAAVLIMDGAGEEACTTWARGDGVSFSKLDEHRLPHSLGHYYAAVTGYLGFKMLDGEYKLMGLSPYGDPSGAQWIRKNFLLDRGNGRYALRTEVLDFHRALRGRFAGAFADYFGEPRPRSDTAEFNDRHRDIAASAQRAFEEVVLAMAGEMRRCTGEKKLCIAGGCGLNCTANGKILTAGVADEIFVPPAPHDSGAALGAAVLLYSRLTGKRPEPMVHAQYGPQFENGALTEALAQFKGLEAEQLDEEELLARCVETLVSQGVIAWFQGRMEFGPRALGNRSFLADPRRDDIRDVINEKIKKRELFRPFAPSVKAEKAAEYFELHQSSPFMTIIVPVRAEKRAVIPAVTHVDGTARPQTVEQKDNPRYWKLLDRFEARTGVPVLLNTSFNIQEPIVCAPKDALATFERSGVDALALGDYWVRRRSRC